jgi:hypothetical protein
METVEQRITPIRNYDLLADFLRVRVRLTPFTFGLVFFAANLVVDLWLGWHYNVFLTPPSNETPGLLQNLTALVVDFVSQPIVAGIYLWTTLGATHLFNQLLQSKVFETENLVFEKVDKSRALFASRWVFHIIWILSLIYALSQVAAYMGWVPWSSAGGYLELYPEMSFARAPFWFLNFYTLAFGAFNVVVTVSVLRNLFRTENIHLLPLHPDRCGGLSSISNYTIKVAYAIASAGLVISAATVYELNHGTLQDAYPIILGIVAYVLLAPLFFFWPLGTAHDAMQEAKETELLMLAQRYDGIYSSLKKDVDLKEGDYEEKMKRLDQLKKLYTIAVEFPVWPFDVENVRRFFAVMTAPLIPALINILIDILISFIKPA